MRQADAIPWRAFAWLLGGEVRAHPGRAILALAALAVGVALGYAVHIVNQSALGEFSRAMATVSGQGDFDIVGDAAGLDEALYGRIAGLPEVGDLLPVAEADAVLGAGAEPIRLIGTDALRAASVSPALLGRPSASSGKTPLDDDAVFLPASVAVRLKLAPGDRIAIEANGRSALFTLAGDLPAQEEDVAVIDIAAFQWRFDRLGKLSRIIVKSRPGVGLATAARALRTLLPPGTTLSSQADRARRDDSLSRAYRVNLDMLALVALITGAFLTFSGQSLSVARRAREFALLRMMGVRRATMMRYVLAEGLALGLIGALLGLGLGAGLATAAVRLLGGDLGGGYFHGLRPSLDLAPGAAALFGGLGVAAALLGSLWPARIAAGLPPVQTLKGITDGGGATGAKLWPGLVLLLLGGAAALAPPVAELPLFGYLAVGLILAGGVAAMPWLLGTLLRLTDRRLERRPVLFLALKPLSYAPRQASIALAGLVASTSLTIAMAIMVASFRHSVDVWLGDILYADLYLRLVPTQALSLTQEDQARLAAVPGLSKISFGKTTMISLAPDRPAMALVVRGESPADLLTKLPAVGKPADGPSQILISEPAAQLLARHPGDRIEIPLGGAVRTLRIGGIFRDYSRQFGAIAIDKDTYRGLTGDATANEAAIFVAARTDRGDLAQHLREAVPALADSLQIADSASLRSMALDLFDRSFLLTYAIEAIATLVGMAGVAATISAQTLARAREFGMLRHLGVRRGQIAWMLLAEGTALGVTGVLCGLGLGGLIGEVLIDVVNPQSFHWTMETVWPVGLLAAAGLSLIAAAAVSARLAGRTALSGGPLMAVREDF
jgi:putative ABC transport system permease protein